MISPQTRENSRIFMEEKGLTMDLLSDPKNQVGEEFNLVYTVPADLKKIYLQLGINLEEYNGDDSWRLPLVARYIIDKGGIIRYSQISVDHTERVDPNHTLNALEKLKL